MLHLNIDIVNINIYYINMSREKRNTSEQKLICKRFGESMDLLNLKPSTAYSALGYSTPATLYSIVAGRCLPDLTKLSHLSKLQTPGGYRINLDWLITGTGKKVLPKGNHSNITSKLEEMLANSERTKHNAMVALLK